MIRLVLNTEVPPDGSPRAWRPPLVARIFAPLAWLFVFMALPALWLQFTVLDNAAPSPEWWTIFAVFAAAWGLLTWRVTTQSVALTPDRLVIRNVLGTRTVPLMSIDWIGFRQGRLLVSSARGAGDAHPAARVRVTVNAVNLGPSYWSGLRGRADEIADTIAAAAGLPALPPRRKLIPRALALAMLPTGAALTAVGAYSDPAWGAEMRPPLPLGPAVAVLLPFGAFTLVIALGVTLDHWRKRRNSAT